MAEYTLDFDSVLQIVGQIQQTIAGQVNVGRAFSQSVLPSAENIYQKNIQTIILSVSSIICSEYLSEAYTQQYSQSVVTSAVNANQKNIEKIILWVSFIICSEYLSEEHTNDNTLQSVLPWIPIRRTYKQQYSKPVLPSAVKINSCWLKINESVNWPEQLVGIIVMVQSHRSL